MVPSEIQMRAHAQVTQRVPILKKAIKKRVRNRYGPDPSYMGFDYITYDKYHIIIVILYLRIISTGSHMVLILDGSSQYPSHQSFSELDFTFTTDLALNNMS